MGNGRLDKGMAPADAAEKRVTDAGSRPVAQGVGARADGTAGRGGDPPDPLGAVGDSLILAHHNARLDGDLALVSLIEKALFHVGRRLARRLQPVEAGSLPH